MLLVLGFFPALKLNNETLEHLLHSTNDAFVSAYVRNGQRYLALFNADGRPGSAGAPAIEWIRAIENPDADNSSGLARLKNWDHSRATAIGVFNYWQECGFPPQCKAVGDNDFECGRP